MLCFYWFYWLKYFCTAEFKCILWTIYLLYPDSSETEWDGPGKLWGVYVQEQGAFRMSYLYKVLCRSPCWSLAGSRLNLGSFPFLFSNVLPTILFCVGEVKRGSLFNE